MEINTSTVLVAALAAIAPTILSIATLVTILKTHKSVNGKLAELLLLEKKASFNAGVKSEKDSALEKETAFKAGVDSLK